jgi:hypothetical protein
MKPVNAGMCLKSKVLFPKFNLRNHQNVLKWGVSSESKSLYTGGCNVIKEAL